MDDLYVPVRDAMNELGVSSQTFYRRTKHAGIEPQRVPGLGKGTFITVGDRERLRETMKRSRPRSAWGDVVQWLDRFGLNPRTIRAAADLTTGPITVTAELVDGLRHCVESGSILELSEEARQVFGLESLPVCLKPGAEFFDVTMGRFHPADLRAACEVASGLGLSHYYENGTLLVRHEVQLRFGTNIISWGAPISNVISRLAFHAIKVGEEQFRVAKDTPLALPFSWLADEHSRLRYGAANRPVHYWLRLANGQALERRSRPNTSILLNAGDTTVLEPEVDEEGMLKSDLLLVTRLPNFLTQRAIQGGCTLTIFAGTHGPGSRSSARLLSTESKAVELVAEIRDLVRRSGTPWFQAILRVKLRPGNKFECSDPEGFEPRGKSWFQPVKVSKKQLEAARVMLSNLELVYKT